MEPVKIGQIIIDSEAQNDAIHVAIAPMIAATELRPGAHVGFVGTGDTNKMEVNQAPVGIVDPFLARPVRAGERFYLFLYPGTITSLRHDWTHPVIQARKMFDPNREALSWLRNFAEECGLTYNDLMDAAHDYVSNGNYLCEGSKFEGLYVPDQFWDFYEKVTGEYVSTDKQGSFFSCSC